MLASGTQGLVFSMLASGTQGLVVSMLASGTQGLVVSMLTSGTQGLVVSMLASGIQGVVVSMLASGTQGLVVSMLASGTQGLVVSMLASGTQVCGFKSGRSRRIFRAKKSSAYLPSEEKESRLSHVAALRHVKEPYNYRGSRNCKAKFDRKFLAHSSSSR